MTRRTVGLLALLALLGTGCGGSGSSDPDFVETFAAIYAKGPNEAPVPIAGATFVNQFPDDEATFNFLLP